MAWRRFGWLVVTGWMALMAGCASPPVKHIDYSAFKASRPRSIVVLPPLNQSPDIDATYGLLSQVTRPLAEAGYYVLPVALVEQTFRENGLTVAGEMHGVPTPKLKEIFGADAALYITVTQYGTRYRVLDSDTVVEADAKLVDLKGGQTLWTGHASASSNEGNNNSNGSLIGMLLTAAVKQIVNSATDQSYKVAAVTSARLLSTGQPDGLLYGPRSPKYSAD